LAGAWPDRSIAERVVPIVGFAAVSWACREGTYSPYGPSFFLERAVWVLAFAALCEWNERRRWPSIIRYAGQNSLKLYVAHLMLISWLIGAGVGSSAMGWPETLVALAAVVAVSFGVSRFLDRLPQALRSLRSAPDREVAVSRDLPSPAS
jgi:peptidoglycan/LPS O-acetylase OafA/YrhL